MSPASPSTHNSCSVRAASPEKRASELADLLEVFDALLQAQNLSLEAVKTIQEKRRAERGGFVQRLKLLWTEQVPR